MNGLVEIVISSAIFLSLWVILSETFFKPYISMLAERQARTVGDEKAIIQKKEQLAAAQANIDSILVQTRLEGIKERDALLAQGKSQAQELVHAATEKAHERLESARATLKQNVQTALFDLERDSDQLADMVVGRVTDTSGTPAIH